MRKERRPRVYISSVGGTSWAYVIAVGGIVAAIAPFIALKFLSFPIVHASMYVGTSVWTYCLELIAGLPQHPRPLPDILIMALNLTIFTANSYFLTFYLTKRDELRDNEAGVGNFLLFFLLFETSIYCVHRYLLHESWLKKYHLMHHARTCDGISGCDLFYMHPIDLLFQFLATSDFGYICSGSDQHSFEFTAMLTMWLYVVAHSRIIEYTLSEFKHLQHHRDGTEHHGTGVFMDLLMSKECRETTNIWTDYVPTWVVAPLLYLLSRTVGNTAVLTLGLLPIMGHTTYKVFQTHGIANFATKPIAPCDCGTEECKRRMERELNETVELKPKEDRMDDSTSDDSTSAESKKAM
jgi:hypothetical protein